MIVSRLDSLSLDYLAGGLLQTRIMGELRFTLSADKIARKAHMKWSAGNRSARCITVQDANHRRKRHRKKTNKALGYPNGTIVLYMRAFHRVASAFLVETVGTVGSCSISRFPQYGSRSL